MMNQPRNITEDKIFGRNALQLRVKTGAMNLVALCYGCTCSKLYKWKLLTLYFLMGIIDFNDAVPSMCRKMSLMMFPKKCQVWFPGLQKSDLCQSGLQIKRSYNLFILEGHIQGYIRRYLKVQNPLKGHLGLAFHIFNILIAVPD